MPFTHEQAIQLIESFAFKGGGAHEKAGEKEKKKPPSAHSDRSVASK